MEVESRPFWLTRREALCGLAAAGLGTAAFAEAGPGVEMVARARDFLALLPPEAHGTATADFANPLRQNWNYMTGSRVSPGLPLERMDAAQKVAAMDLLATGLSPEGLAKAERVMLLQDVLRDEIGKGSADRNSERFSMLIFGTPGDVLWGWRFEGHHLTLNYTLRGNEVVSVTPSSFSSDPNAVPSGPHQGMIALEKEEVMGRQIYGALSPKARGAALLQEASFGNVLATAGREGRVGARAGIPFADLTQGEIDFLMELVGVYATDHLPNNLANQQFARLREGDLMATHFGWAGSEDRGSIYYRIHGDTFLVEFATLRNQPQHHHTTRHDFERNLGAHIVG